MLNKAPPVPQQLTNGSNEDSSQLPASDSSGGLVNNAVEGGNATGSLSDLPEPGSESGVIENTGEAPADDVTHPHMPEVSLRESTPRVPMAPHTPAIAALKPKHDRLLTLSAFGLTLAILALVIKKFLKISGLADFIEGKF
jgi:ubiquitin-conjugating enzyme E2 J1